MDCDGLVVADNRVGSILPVVRANPHRRGAGSYEPVWDSLGPLTRRIPWAANSKLIVFEMPRCPAVEMPSRPTLIYNHTSTITGSSSGLRSSRVSAGIADRA